MPENPALVVRVAANLADLKANLAEGRDQIEATSASMQKMAASFQGDRLIQSAHNTAAAIDQIGGVSKLTESELARVNDVLDKAIAKYEAMGKEAPLALRQLAEQTKDTHGSWNNFVQDFDVKGAIEQPLGSAKQALTAFGETLGPTGTMALEAAGLLTAVGAAAFELASRAAEAGDRLGDLADKTGLSVPALSRYGNAAQVTGHDLDGLTSAFFQLQRGIGEGSDKVDAGLQRIGLSSEELKKTQIDDWLQVIAERFEATTDPSTRAAAVMEIFGKQGRELLPVLLDLDKGLKATSDIEPWTKQQADAAEHFEIQMKSLKIHVEALGTAFGRNLMDRFDSFGAAIGSLGSKLVWLNEHTLGGAGQAVYQYVTAGLDLLTGHLKETDVQTGQASVGLNNFKDSVAGLALPTNHLIDAHGKLTDAGYAASAAEKDLTETLKEQTKEREAAAKVLEHVLEIERGIHKEAVNALGLSADENKATQAAIDRRLAGYKAIDAAHADLVDAINKRTLSSADYQIVKIWEHVEEQKKAWKGEKDQYEQYIHDIVMAAYEKEQAIRDSDARIIAAEQAVVDVTYQEAQSLERIQSNIRGAAIGATVSPGAGEGIIPRQSGGPVSASTPYLVGERGPELFVPSRAGAIVPNAGGGGITVAITINGSVLSDESKIARAVGDAMMTRLRALGVRLPMTA